MRPDVLREARRDYRSVKHVWEPSELYVPGREAGLAAHAVSILGDPLLGLAIGNVPNGYTVKNSPDGAVIGRKWKLGFLAEDRRLIRRQYHRDTRSGRSPGSRCLPKHSSALAWPRDRNRL